MGQKNSQAKESYQLSHVWHRLNYIHVLTTDTASQSWKRCQTWGQNHVKQYTDLPV